MCGQTITIAEVLIIGISAFFIYLMFVGYIKSMDTNADVAESLFIEYMNRFRALTTEEQIENANAEIDEFERKVKGIAPANVVSNYKRTLAKYLANKVANIQLGI